jgi:hypothetical protein
MITLKIEVQISGKTLRHPPPPPLQLQMFRYVPEATRLECINNYMTLPQKVIQKYGSTLY